MELALIITAAIGALLFVLGYLAFIIGGFKHHFVTGVISALPVLNIVTLPSLWYNNKGKLAVSTLGLIIFIAAWVFGANKNILQLLSGKSVTQKETVMLSTPKTNTKIFSQPVAENVDDTQKQQRALQKNTDSLLQLPSKALYSMVFENVPTDRINTLENRVVKIKLNNNNVIEGRVLSVNSSSVLLSGAVENEIPIANIKTLSLMVKKAH